MSNGRRMRRRAGRRPIAGAPEYATVVGCAADPWAIEEAKRITHDSLIRLVGDGRLGPVEWKLYGPAQWRKVLAEMAGQVGDRYAAQRAFLERNPDGWLVVALCPAVRGQIETALAAGRRAAELAAEAERAGDLIRAENVELYVGDARVEGVESIDLGGGGVVLDGDEAAQFERTAGELAGAFGCSIEVARARLRSALDEYGEGDRRPTPAEYREGIKW